MPRKKIKKNLAPKSFLSKAFSTYKKNKEINKIKAIKLEKLKEKNQIIKERKELKIWEEKLIKENMTIWLELLLNILSNW